MTFGQKAGNFSRCCSRWFSAVARLRDAVSDGLAGAVRARWRPTHLVDDNTRPEREIVEPEPAAPAPVAEGWSCFWDPTMNENWHDDVLRTRGYEAIRCELLVGQSFVTQDDMMRVATDCEMALNQ
ncbi:hypothetical protein [Microbacterium sp. NPDC058389]|uniref:hypothetical protein n=1 Tax=Microbacterium sp. NPDC058389 TaxID=3346475 RepID=UPI0036528E22